MTVREELDDLKFRLRIKTDEELAKQLDTSKSSVDRWVSRKKIPDKWQEIIRLKFYSADNISNNANSVIVNGLNNGSIVNSHQHKVSSELMEFIELFEEYGNNKILQEFKDKLLKIKEVTQ